jgi:hypothetical protein
MTEDKSDIKTTPSTTPTTPSTTPTGQVPPEQISSSGQSTGYTPKEEIKHIYFIVVGIVIFVVASFLLDHFLLVYDNSKQKDLDIKYMGMQDSYFLKILDLKDGLSKQESTIKDLDNEIKLLRAKNLYLK